MSAAGRLARFAAQLRFEDLPAAVIDGAKLRLLDTFGCGLAACGLGVGQQAASAISGDGASGPATVIGSVRGGSAAQAALANGTLCHALEFDDTHAPSLCHLSVVVGPAAIAAGQERGASGREVLTAFVAGTEVAARLALAGGQVHRRGFDPTGVWGVHGATVAAARIARLDALTTRNALGIAGSLGGGLIEGLDAGATTLRLHAGWAAHSGVCATRLAEHGSAGPATVYEGRFGVLQAYGGQANADVEPQLLTLGDRWETLRSVFKAFPACHFSHGVLGALAELLGRERCAAEDVVDVVVTLPESTVGVVAEPQASKRRPRSSYEAAFSVQFAAASMLVDGRVDVQTFARSRIDDARVLALADRVRYEVAAYETFPGAYPGGARVRLRDGRTLTATVAYQLGSDQNPLGSDAIVEKYRANASLALPRSQVSAVEEAILTLEAHDDVGAALRPLGEAAA